MLLFLYDIPPGVSREELARVVRAIVHGGWLARLFYHPRVEKADILKIRVRDSRTWEHHGLIRITPSNAGPVVMEMLRKTRLWGRLPDVRAYHSRRPYDRRRAYTDPCLLDFPERRQSERRREQQIVTTRPGDSRTTNAPPQRYDWQTRHRPRNR